MNTIITPRRLNIIIPVVPPRKNQNKVAEATVVHATAVAIAEAARVVADGVAHRAAVKVAAVIQNQRATVALRAASKKELVNAVIVAEVVTARYRLATTSRYFWSHEARRLLTYTLKQALHLS